MIASRKRRPGSSTSIPSAQQLETRTLLAAPNPLALSSLDGTTGFVLTGIDTDDYSGFSVSGAGDVNGDGFEDLIIGAFTADQNGTDAEGEAYVVFGRSGGFAASISLSSLDGTNGFVLTGDDAGDGAGFSVSGAGDVNGDGLDDLIIAAPYASQGGAGYHGESYVVFGRTGAFAASIALSNLDGTTGFVLTGVDAGDYSGISVSGAGDVNGDGFHDLIIGAYKANQSGGNEHGESYVVFGQSGGFAPSISLSSLDGTTGFALTGIDPEDRAGRSVSGAGDVNGDGLDDIIVGAYRADQGGGNYHGESYVVFGRTGGFGPSIALSSLDGTTGFVLTGIDPVDVSGRSVSNAGDVNGDGFDDMIIGASGADQGGANEGESYVVFGRSGGFAASISLSSLDGTTGFVLTGVDTDDNSGTVVSGAGDVNSDGFDDLFVGAPLADPVGGSGQGESYVVFGHSGPFTSSIALSSLDGNNGFVLTGVDNDDNSGSSLNAAGDVNGDGFDDLIIGAYYASQAGGIFQGESYVVFGGNFTGGAETQVGGDGSQTLTANQGAAVDILVGGRGDDTLISDGGDDVLRGGEGDDILAIPDANFSPRRLQGGTGSDTLRLDGAGITLDLTAIADNRISGIEVLDITGNGINTLTLDVREVLNLSDSSNTLIVRRDDDVVNQGAGWVQQPNEMIDGDLFNVFTQGAATLKVQSLAVPPVLTATVINGGSPNRSGIATFALTFDIPVNVAAVTSLQLFNHSVPALVDISTAGLSGNGTTTVTWDFTPLTLADGRYTAEIPGDQVTTGAGGQLASTQTTEFHVFRGDASGDARVNASDFVTVDANFDPLPGDPFRSGDANGDGLVNASDFVEVDANFDPILLPPLTFDFGDAPEAMTMFPTTLGRDGARHVITGNALFLGADRDAEADGQPNADASGDGADEDGVLVGNLDVGTNVVVMITSSGAGFVNGWVDFNQDGDWDDAGEQVFTDQAVVGGPNNVPIAVPAGATLGSTIARFRLTGTAGYSYLGLAPDGEVEDYQVMVTTPPPPTTESLAASSSDSDTTLRALSPWWISRQSGGNSLFASRSFSLFGRSLSLFTTGSPTRFRGR